MSYSAVNGLGLALVIPAAQSLVADYYEEKSRGGAFGLLFGVSSLGARLQPAHGLATLCPAGTAWRAWGDRCHVACLPCLKEEHCQGS